MANIFRAKSLISRTGTFSHEATAPNLVYNTGDQNISGIKDFNLRPTVNGTGVLLSGEAASLPTTIVYTTGDQIISGNKIFVNNLEIQGTGIFNNIDLSNISSFSFSGVTIDLINSLINSSGQILISGNPVLTGVDLNPYATNANLALTGSNLDSKINSLSGSFDLSGANITNTISSLSGSLNSSGISLINRITSLSGLSVLITGNQIISGNKTFANDINVSGTGIFNALDLNNIDSLSLSGIDISITGSTVNVYGNIFISGNPVLTGTTLAQTGSNLQNQINSLSGQVVFTTGSQTINGAKIFTTGIDIYSGFNPQAIRVFNRTGLNTGEFAIFEWRNDELRIGATQTQSGLLRDVILTGRNININASGALNIFDPTNISGNLNVTGNILLSGNNILNIFSSLSGSLNSTGIGLFNTISSLSGSLNNTGINLLNRINSLSGNVVFLTGNQNIGGNKTFTGITTFSGQEVNLVDTALNLSGVGDMTFSGTNINFINSPVLISGTDLRVSGNVLAYNLNNIVYTTGNQLVSGVKTFANNVIYPVSPRTSGTNFTPNADLYTFFDFVLTGNSTLNEPTNMSNGESITIFLNQDSSGSRTMSFNSAYLFSNGITPSLNFVPSGVDIMQVIRVNNKYFSTFASNY